MKLNSEQLKRQLKSYLRELSPRRLAEERAEKNEGRPKPVRRYLAKGFSAVTPNFVKNRIPRLQLDPVAEKKLRFIVGYLQVMFIFLCITIGVFFLFRSEERRVGK